jgi:phosphate/sulfate permease
VSFLLWASWVFLCILHVFLGAILAFLIKFSYLSKKKCFSIKKKTEGGQTLKCRYMPEK